MIHRVWQILTSLQRLITLDTKVQLQHGRYHLKDMTHIFLPIKRNKLITPFFIYISMVFCCPSTLCCIPGQLHLLIIFYPLCRRRGRGWTKKSVARSQIPVLVSPPHLPGRRTQSKGREYSVQEALLSKKIYHPLPSSGETKVILPSSITMLK